MPIIVKENIYLTTSEVLERVSVSRQTLWRWRQEQVVPTGYRHRNGRLLFSESDVEKILTYNDLLEPAGNTYAVKQTELPLFSGVHEELSHE
jgi:predicted DNA-binding transcriptional regulator AlpA